MPETSTLISQFYLKLSGDDAPAELMRALMGITVENSLHMPDVATLNLHDPQLQWIDDARLAAGKTIQVLAASSAVNSQPEVVFDGEIVELEPEFRASTHHLFVRAFDRLHRLSRGRQVRTFQNVTDADVVQRLAREVGLQPEVEQTRQVHKYLIQYNQTNFEFLRQRAAALGYLLYAEGTKLCFKPPAQDVRAIELQWGATLSEFRPRLTTIAQLHSVTARGWDPQARQEIVSQVTRADGKRDIGITQTGGQMVQDAFHLEANYLVANHPVRTSGEAEQLAQAVADRQAERLIEAEGTCGGNPAIVAGASVKIDAVGNQFSGTYFVTATTHLYGTQQGYVTHFNISGQTPSSLLRFLSVDEEQSFSGAGLVIGIVTDNQDPDGWGRVKIKYPWLSGEHTSDWARVVSIGAGAQRGIEFLPEINDEVLVGFEMGDVHHPYVLGGLWNGQDAPPKKNQEAISNGRVEQRVIYSRTGHRIVLDDSDGSSSITIADKNGNQFRLDTKANKVVIESTGDLMLKASGQVDIQGSALKLKASGQVDMQGSVINLN